MTEDAKIKMLAGRIAALEVISTTALGLYLANSRNDAGLEKAMELLNQMRALIASKDRELSPEALSEAVGYGGLLLDRVAGMLPTLAGTGGRLN